MREGLLNVNSMGVRWGVKQQILRQTKINEIWPDWILLQVGDEQVMVFKEGNEGPFYLPDNHQINQKYDQMKGKQKMVTKTKNKRRVKDERTHCERIL